MLFAQVCRHSLLVPLCFHHSSFHRVILLWLQARRRRLQNQEMAMCEAATAAKKVALEKKVRAKEILVGTAERKRMTQEENRAVVTTRLSTVKK